MHKKMRAYHFDLKRGLWSKAYMEQIVQQLQRWQYNTIVLEFEDKMQFSCVPGIAAPDALSPAEVGAFVEDCRQHGIDVIPLVQTLGHAESVVGLEPYAHLREAPEVKDQYDPMSAEARRVIMGLIDDVIDAVRPREYLHIGGDETWSLGCGPRSREVVAREGIGGLYLQHMRPLWDHVRSRGLRPMMWADMFLSYPQIIEQVPDDVLLVDWDYWTDAERPENIMVWGGFQHGDRNKMISMQDYDKALAKDAFRTMLHPYAVDAASKQDGRFLSFYGTRALKAHGAAEVMVASANSCGGDSMGLPRSELHLANCWHGARLGMQAGQGMLVTSWAVRHVHQEVKQLGTFAASLGVSGDRYDLDDLCMAYTKEVYGVAMPELAQVVRLTCDRFTAGQAHTLTTAHRGKANGEDGIARFLDQEAEECGGRDALCQRMRRIRQSHAQASELIQEMQTRAERQQQNLAFWSEGVALNGFYLDYAIARFEGTLPSRRRELHDQLVALEEHTKALFAPTLTDCGLKVELDARYGYHRLALEQ